MIGGITNPSRGALQVAIGLALAPLPSANAAEDPRCRVGAETQTVLDSVGRPASVRDECRGDEACRQALLTRVEAALDRHPTDVLLHRMRQDLTLYWYEDGDPAWAAHLADYRDRRDAAPLEPIWQYLYGRLLVRDRGSPETTGTARESFARALELDPDFGWAHLGMALESVRADGQEGAASEHLTRFLDLCPTRIAEGLRYASVIGDAAFWEARLPGLRAAIKGDLAHSLDALPSLWALEFRSAPPEEHDAVRERVRRDLAALDIDAAETSRERLEVAIEGHRLLGGWGEVARLEDRLIAARPCSSDSARRVTGRWWEEHPRPEPGTAADDRAAWLAAYDGVTREWIALCPDSFEYVLERFWALAERDDAPPAELTAVAERALALEETSSGRMSPPLEHVAAQAFVQHGVGLDRIPGLAAAEREALTEQARRAEDASPGKVADQSGWEPAEIPLPAFAVPDLSGRIWKADELAGESVFVNVWATWCGPCRAELPWVERLAAELRPAEGVRVVTLDIDSNPGLVAPYIAQNGFTFPVLLAYADLGELAREGIPLNWIVDPRGVIRFEQRGFDAAQDYAAWAREIRNLLDDVRR